MRSPWRTASVFLSVLATVVVLGVGEAAQAACYGAGEQLPGPTLSQFINDPGRLLTQFPNGGPQMIALIRDLVASDPGTLPLVINLDGKANNEQVQAIGTGLGQAALVCKRTAQAFSNEIQQMTIAANNRALTQAFAGVMGDLFLGLEGPSVGGGGAGQTGQVGPTGGVAAGGAPLNLSTSVRTPTGNSFTPSHSFGAASTGSSGNGTGGSSSIFSGNPGGLPGSSSQGTSGTPGSSSSVSSFNKPASTSPSRP
jgi:hypothetical protein